MLSASKAMLGTRAIMHVQNIRIRFRHTSPECFPIGEFVSGWKPVFKFLLSNKFFTTLIQRAFVP